MTIEGRDYSDEEITSASKKQSNCFVEEYIKKQKEHDKLKQEFQKQLTALEEKFSNTNNFPAALYQEYQHLDKIAPYKDALFAFVEIDLAKAQMEIAGIQSDWIAPSPAELNVPEQVYGARNSPEISDRVLNLANRNTTL